MCRNHSPRTVVSSMSSATRSGGAGRFQAGGPAWDTPCPPPGEKINRPSVIQHGDGFSSHTWMQSTSIVRANRSVISAAPGPAARAPVGELCPANQSRTVLGVAPTPGDHIMRQMSLIVNANSLGSEHNRNARSRERPSLFRQYPAKPPSIRSHERPGASTAAEHWSVTAGPDWTRRPDR